MEALVELDHKLELLSPALRKEAFLFIEFLTEKSRNGNNAGTKRKYGSAKGKIHISEDFDQPVGGFLNRQHLTTKERIAAFCATIEDKQAETDWGKPQGKEIW